MKNSLSELTTIGIGGAAKRLSVVTDRETLIERLALGENALLLGRGSNVLASDDGYDGEVIVNRYESATVFGTSIVAGSGARLSELSRIAAEANLSGLEWACGIPGSVGGAVRMNAGAFGRCVADVLLYADVLRGGEIKSVPREALGFSYRSSALKNEDAVISATFALFREDKARIRASIAENARWRRKVQPRGRSAGSVFKNPEGCSAGAIIERAGLKGYRVGGAIVSREHANVIVNLGGATAKDALAVIDKMRGALEDFGVAAEEEIVYIGELR